MNIRKTVDVVACAGVLSLAVAATGCATKKYVRETLAPVQQKVSDLEKKTTEQAGSIDELQKGVSRADERATSADNRAGAAAREAARANEQAAMAGKAAENARAMTEKETGRATQAERVLATRIENADNFKPVSTESILFAFGRSDLSKEAQAQLDAAARKIAGMKHYLIEVQGFTDKTGPADYNLELSRKRAASVVRYLTVQHKLPLHRIHVMGYGAESPAADNRTRDGRKQNRRVEVRVYAAEMGSS